MVHNDEESIPTSVEDNSSHEEFHSIDGTDDEEYDSDDVELYQTRRAGIRVSRRNTSSRTHVPSGSHELRRNPKRYTTDEMDREIAASIPPVDSDEEDYDDDQSEHKEPAQKLSSSIIHHKSRYKTNMKMKNTIRRKDAHSHGSDSEQEIFSSDESNEDEEEWDQQQVSDDDGSDEEESTDEDFRVSRSSKKRSKRKNTAPQRKSKPSSGSARATTRRTSRIQYQRHHPTHSNNRYTESEEEVESQSALGVIRRPRRQCAAITQERMHEVVQQDMKTEREALCDVLEDDDKELLEKSESDEEDSKNNKDEYFNGRNKSKRHYAGSNSIDMRRRNARKKHKYDEDEDYDEVGDIDHSDSTSDEVKYSTDDENLEEESYHGTHNKFQQRYGSRNQSKKMYTEVDEEVIGTADENSVDEETGPSIIMSPTKVSNGTYGSPTSRRNARGKIVRKPLDIHEYYGSESSGDDQLEQKRRKHRKVESYDERGQSNRNETSFQHKNSTKIPPSPTKLRTTINNCPSTTDGITMMTLPKDRPHVCFIAPDGKTRHCFTIDTLYRIAITKKDISDSISTQPLQFLQPPHFRTPMSDDLIDQIASRFGRSALVIENSTLFKKMNRRNFMGIGSAVDIDDEMDEFDSDGEYTGAFNRRGLNFHDCFQKFVQNLMGTQDIYCCPLCYNEAYRRLGNMEDEEIIADDATDDEKNDSPGDCFSFLDDPLTILGHLDQYEYEVASTFCFKLLSGVKNHLKSVHLVDVSIIQGNDLFKRFQIRASDGLLQRWLRKSLNTQMVQGDMMRYWLGGENQSFVLLLNQIDEGELEGEQSGEYGSEFSFSFPNRAKKVWEEVSSPFLKIQEDLNDFLANEDDEEEESFVPINPNFTPPTLNGEGKLKTPEDEIIEYLRKKNENMKSDLQEKGSSQSDSDQTDELEVLSMDAEEKEVEDDDEWMKSKQYTKRKSNTKSPNVEEDSDNDTFDRTTETSTIQVPGNDTTGKEPTVHMKSLRKRIVDSSDDDL